MFFCHFAKSICSNVNIAIVGPGAAKRKKKKRDSALVYFEFHLGWFSQYQQSYVVFTWAQLRAEPVSRASLCRVPSTCFSQQVGIAGAWHFLGFFSNTFQGDFLFKRTKKFCHNKHKNNICEWISKHLSVQWGGSCLWYFSPDSRVDALEGYAWRSGFFIFNATQRNISGYFLPFLCEPLWFWRDSSMSKFIAVSRLGVMLVCQAEHQMA